MLNLYNLLIMNKRDRLKIFIRHLISAKIVKTQKDLGVKLGYENESYFSQIINGHTSEPTDFIEQLKTLEPLLNTDWLEYGIGEMLKSNTTPIIQGDITIGDVNNSNISNVGHGNTYNVPAASQPHQQCKCAIYPMLPDHVVRALDTNVEEWKRQNPDQCKMIDLRELIGEISHVQKMIGRVMEPDIPEGTLLFLRELNQWDEAMLDGSIYGVDIARPHMVVRRVFDDGDHIRCEPVNPIFGTVRIPKEKVMNLYKIAYGLKKFD